MRILGLVSVTVTHPPTIGKLTESELTTLLVVLTMFFLVVADL